MLTPLLGLIVLAVTLTVLFWFGAQSLQEFLYTNASEWLYWQAPLAATLIALFLVVWWLVNLSFASPSTREIPFGVPWEFSARVDVIVQPVPEFESKRRASEPAIYEVDKSSPNVTKYRRKDSEEYWNSVGTEFVKFTHDGRDYNFVPDKERTSEAGYIVFVDASSGLEMSEYEIGRVGYTSLIRFHISHAEWSASFAVGDLFLAHPAIPLLACFCLGY